MNWKINLASSSHVYLLLEIRKKNELPIGWLRAQSGRIETLRVGVFSGLALNARPESLNMCAGRMQSLTRIYM